MRVFLTISAAALATSVFAGRPAGACPDAEEREWGSIGKALAAGWFDPLPLPEAEPRLLGTLSSERKFSCRVDGGVLKAVFDMEMSGEEKAKGARAYIEAYDSLGYRLGRYVEDPGRHVETRPLVIVKPGEKVSMVFAAGKAKDVCTGVRGKLFVTPFPVVPRCPADGATLDDNTPDFAWYTEDPIGCTVEVSKNPAFAAAGVLRQTQTNNLPFLSWSVPLDKGKWYWRAVTQSGFVGETRSFVQTASPRDDRTPPDVFVAPKALSSPESKYGFHVGTDTASLKVRCGEEDLTVAFRNGLAAAKPPKGGWPRGVRALSVVAADRAGNVATAAVYVACNPGVPVIRWGRAGEPATADGVPFEPRGLYGVGHVIDGYPNGRDLELARKAGFNFVQAYSRDQEPDASARLLRRFDEIEEANLRTMISFNRAQVRGQRFDLIAAKMDGLVGRKGMLGWYLMDEPNSQDKPTVPVILRRLNRFVRMLDPAHPTLMSLDGPRQISRYAGCADVHLTQSYRKTAEEFAAGLDAAQKDFTRHDPSILQTGIANVRKAADADELRKMFSAARERGCGFMVYALFECLDNPEVLSRLEKATAERNVECRE